MLFRFMTQAIPNASFLDRSRFRRQSQTENYIPVFYRWQNPWLVYQALAPHSPCAVSIVHVSSPRPANKPALLSQRRRSQRLYSAMRSRFTGATIGRTRFGYSRRVYSNMRSYAASLGLHEVFLASALWCIDCPLLAPGWERPWERHPRSPSPTLSICDRRM